VTTSTFPFAVKSATNHSTTLTSKSLRHRFQTFHSVKLQAFIITSKLSVTASAI
jgi:hypothetical protein